MSANFKRFIRLFLYAIFLGYLLILGTNYERHLRLQKAVNMEIFPHMTFVIIFPIIVGLLFSLPRFLDIRKKEGDWSFDYIKLLAFGLPAFLATIYPAVYFSTLGKYLPRFLNELGVQMTDPRAHMISGVVFGYLMLSSLNKNSNMGIKRDEDFID